MFKGVIFDYNSTLFFDLDLQERAWKRLFLESGCKEEDFDDFFKRACNVPNKVSIEEIGRLTGTIFSEEENAALSHQKEVYYHEETLINKRDHLAEGSEELLEFLLEKGFKINLCTASIAFNVDFYFENTHLERWFDRDLVAHDDGICLNKTEMFKKAAANIGLSTEECLIFEDSARSISNAIDAGFDKFIYVNHYSKETINRKEILQEIRDYADLDYSIFRK